MKKEQGIVVFDIGKTHKKCFVFSLEFQLLFEKSVKVDPIPDEDGFLSDDLHFTLDWMEGLLKELLLAFTVKKVNFSAHGASFVLLIGMGSSYCPYTII